MENLILDLRGNGGGYLNTAIDLSDEFLDAGKTYRLYRWPGMTGCMLPSFGKMQSGK